MVRRKLHLTVVGRGLAFLPGASPIEIFGFSTVRGKLRPNVVGHGLAFAEGANKGHKYPFAPFICAL
jgi:hypothetical protein